MIEVQCTSCHTRYRIDEKVLPEGLPTFKCSRCGHVFTFEPRKSRLERQGGSAASKPGGAAETPDQSFVRRAGPHEGSEAPSCVVGREAPSEPSPSFQESVASGAL